MWNEPLKLSWLSRLVLALVLALWYLAMTWALWALLSALLSALR